MDEHQKKLNQRHEGRPRKVRFKISSAYSGRVLKQVYEDGQELEPPAKERTRRFLRHSFEPGDRFCGAGETPENRAGRADHHAESGSSGSPGIISLCRVYLYRRDTDKTLLQASPILDFGKIIIYTNNLKIIRAPMDQKELMRRIIQTEGVNDWAFIHRERKERLGGGHKRDVEKKAACSQYVQGRDASHGCSRCLGSGSAPCSLCHGSKFSMLANRFRESYRALRCPACNESGLQPCQVCAA
ncbi:Glutaredoxin domain-containing cysteine-rich protein 2 [Buceros rhinoceros silvestris]|uniref:Glutaredoxin domain-containing cysteine-rich protein 2 n=1 Tax=Buceros rhinoceros silvestris TaxID=175836 RepID=A0A091HBM0_BUCRH|nr:Glutaredoxin domain-containing cysteine-rich protein 2 [Buceros rhinoceros silvestris]